MLLLHILVLLIGINARATAADTASTFRQDQPSHDAIVNGTEIVPQSRPYLVRALKNNIFSCGASLISPRAILTAAHCVVSSDGWSPLDAFEFFRHNVTNNTGVVTKTINNTSEGGDVLVHPLYNRTTHDYDAAIVFLPDAMNDITPVILNEDPAVPIPDAPLDVAGWGRIEYQGEVSDVPLGTTVNYLTEAQCTSPPRGYTDAQITNNMLCAAANGTDVCNGDSGGPLVLSGSDGGPTVPVVQVGIVSWNTKEVGTKVFGCASIEYPGVQTRVSAVADWIKDTVCNRTGELCIATDSPTNSPINQPTTANPTRKPTSTPTRKGTTNAPTRKGTTNDPTRKPTTSPSTKPTKNTGKTTRGKTNKVAKSHKNNDSGKANNDPGMDKGNKAGKASFNENVFAGETLHNITSTSETAEVGGNWTI